MNQRNIRLILTFNGAGYHGWQKQKNAPSVQMALEKAIGKSLKETIRTIGIGRTDAGAHAFRYTANFQTRNLAIPCGKLPRILNRELPEDIRVLSAEEMPGSFHSRYSALAREYVYLIFNGKTAEKTLPIIRDLVFVPEEPVDAARVRKACGYFKGKHDFRNFCYGYGNGMDFRREIFYFRAKEIHILNTPVIVFFIKGNGFLKGMIRSIVSACLSYARGDISGEMIRSALKNEKSLDPKYRVPVPASGLYFKRGFYR